jgi:hypothetical protein
MKFVTRKRIAQAIKEKTGLDGEVWISDGCAHFYSDTDNELSTILSNKMSNCVYLCRLNHQSIDDWVEDFERILKGE